MMKLAVGVQLQFTSLLAGIATVKCQPWMSSPEDLDPKMVRHLINTGKKSMTFNWVDWTTVCKYWEHILSDIE